MRELSCGDTLPNGARVLLASPIKGNSAVTPAYQVVLCVLQEDKYATWTWRCVEQYSGGGNYFADGNKIESLLKAIEDFKIRSERHD